MGASGFHIRPLSLSDAPIGRFLVKNHLEAKCWPSEGMGKGEIGFLNSSSWANDFLGSFNIFIIYKVAGVTF